jgi:O-antigen ligase
MTPGPRASVRIRRRYLLVIVILALSYVNALGAAVAPVAVAVMAGCPVCVPRPLTKLRGPLLLMAALVLCFVMSALIYPSAVAASVLATLIACATLMLVSASTDGLALLRPLTVVAVLVSVVLLLWSAAVDPAELASKSPVARLVLGGLGAGRLLLVGAGIVHQNEAASIAALAACAATALYLTDRPRHGLDLPLAVVAAAVVVTSGSRGAMLASVAGLSSLVAIRFPASRLTIAALALAAGLVGLWIVGADSGLLGSADDATRLNTWTNTLHAVLASPFLGWGIGAFPYVYSHTAIGAFPPGAHNTFLDVWLEAGAAGLLALIAVVCAALIAAFRNPDPRLSAVTVALLVAWLVDAQFESTIVLSWSGIGDLAQPWLDWHELVSPIPFVLFGLAFSTPVTKDAPKV